MTPSNPWSALSQSRNVFISFRCVWRDFSKDGKEPVTLELLSRDGSAVGCLKTWGRMPGAGSRSSIAGVNYGQVAKRRRSFSRRSQKDVPKRTIRSCCVTSSRAFWHAPGVALGVGTMSRAERVGRRQGWLPGGRGSVWANFRRRLSYRGGRFRPPCSPGRRDRSRPIGPIRSGCSGALPFGRFRSGRNVADFAAGIVVKGDVRVNVNPDHTLCGGQSPLSRFAFGFDINGTFHGPRSGQHH